MTNTSDEIALTEVIAVQATGERLPVRIVVERPCRTVHGDWSCQATGSPLVHFPHVGVHGFDSLQALALAVTLLRLQLEEFVAKGGRILHVGADDDVDIGATFGTGLRP